MTEHTEAPVSTDVELRALWQQAGGTIYSTNREVGAMPTLKLLPFLRGLMVPGAVPSGMAATASPATPDSSYAAALIKLIAAVCPGLDTGNLLEDARKATEAVAAGAVLAGHFGIDDEPATDGSARYVHVATQHKDDPDVFPLFRRPATVDELKATLQAHADLHQLKSAPDAAAATSTTKATTKAAQAAAAAKAAAK